MRDVGIGFGRRTGGTEATLGDVLADLARRRRIADLAADDRAFVAAAEQDGATGRQLARHEAATIAAGFLLEADLSVVVGIDGELMPG
jgi:hypothetical protein